MPFARGIEEDDGPVKKLINTMPAEVVIFYTGAVTTIQEFQVAIGETAVLWVLKFAFVLGFILTYLTAKNDSSISMSQIGLMLISFFFWSWAVGNPLTLLLEPAIVPEAVPGIILLLWSSFMALLPAGSFSK